MAAYVGLPSIDDSVCAYAPDIASDGCTAAPVVHLIVHSEAWGVVGLASCEPHVPIARAAGVVLDEHPPAPECAQGCAWPPTDREAPR